MQTSANVTIPTLEELQQRFHTVPRFRDPNKRDYVWFQADDVARVFRYSDFNEDLMQTMNYFDCVCVGRSKGHSNGTQDINTLGPDFNPFLQKYKKVLNQFGVALFAQRSRLPFCIRFKYWLYSTYSLTELNNEPMLRDLEIVEDGSCVIEARKAPKSKVNTMHDNTPEKEQEQELHRSHETHDIEYERELTKRLEIEKKFQLEMCKLELCHLEIVREHTKKNV